MLPRQFKKKGNKCFGFLVIAVNAFILYKHFLSDDKSGELIPEKVVAPVKVLTDADERIDWHDYEFIDLELKRIGPGEQGRPTVLTDAEEIGRDKQSFNDDGFSAVISDKISPNRSLPDVRHDKCKRKKHFKDLPTVSVIVIFYDERLSLMKRCLHSIWNRTPKQLLHEIILIDDMSSQKDLHENIKNYAAENFGAKIKLFRNVERMGLIRTRLDGARKATGEVILFLDSHMEVNVNWLPPLLEPIRINPQTISVPILDAFSPFTLEYEPIGHGTRGGFDWGLNFKWMPMRPQDVASSPDPFEYPVMTGGGYAIRKDYFFELGGYDEGMMIWNGENYEMSFKVWLCGGRMVQVPCSHVAHSSKLSTKYKSVDYGFDYSARNLKRVAEVWMDDYKKELYKSDPKRYRNVDAGDLTKAFELKKKLNCKPFQYFLETVAPEICERYTPESWGNFASGSIISDAKPSLCITFMFRTYEEPLELTDCSSNLVYPGWSHFFIFTWNRFIKYNDASWKCIDSVDMNLLGCDFKFDHQFWKYDLKTHQILNPRVNECITAQIDTKKLSVQHCNDTDINQKFTWGYLNTTAFENWETYGAKMPKTR